jgi:hypothetical protein
MYAIMGITGQIGSVIGRTFLAAKQPVRAVVRDAGKGQVWADRGCEIALANIEDTASRTTAFRGAEGVFVLMPPNFDPAPGFLRRAQLRRLCGPPWKLRVRRESFTSPRLEGFNEGWIEFEHGEAGSQKGNERLESVLKALIEREANAH